MLPKEEEGARVSSHSFHSSASDPHGDERGVHAHNPKQQIPFQRFNVGGLNLE